VEPLVETLGFTVFYAVFTSRYVEISVVKRPVYPEKRTNSLTWLSGLVSPLSKLLFSDPNLVSSLKLTPATRYKRI